MNADSENTTPEDFDAILQEVRRRFIISSPEGYFSDFDKYDSSHPLASNVNAFKSNLLAAISVASIPFTLIHQATFDLRFQQIHMAERIRTLKQVKPNEKPSRELDEQALDTARKKVSEELAGEKTRENLARKVVVKLGLMAKNSATSSAADDLLRQLLVMCWGAFEAVTRDVLASTLNLKPELIDRPELVKLLKDTFGFRGVDTETLFASGLNLSGKIGTIITEKIKIDSISDIREIVRAVLGDEALNKTLSESKLYLLFKQRSLIVHNQSIVDKMYSTSTSDTRKIGDKISFTASEVEDYLGLVKRAGLQVVDAASDRIASPAEA